MNYCECSVEEIEAEGFSVRNGKVVCNNCGNLDYSEFKAESKFTREIDESELGNHLEGDQPTFVQMQALLQEVREVKELVKVLRWVIPLGFFTLMMYYLWFGVKVNISPTIITPWSG